MKEKKRTLIQAAAALASNAHLSGFVTGNLYRGKGKITCVPGLNCYSCPGAVGACPVGSLQAVMGGRGRNFSFYVVGLLLLFGVLFGRLICGFLCPFGFLQDLLHKISSPKPKIPGRADQALRWVKYGVLAAAFLLPILWTDPFGIGQPAFCKYLCPAGTLEGGLPLMLHRESIRAAAGALFSWKAGVLGAVILASVLLYRPFCKYLCPLGAMYGLLNRFSIYQMTVEEEQCTHCGTCERTCKMGVKVTEKINSAECIRCGLCRTACPTGAICAGWKNGPKREPRKKQGKHKKHGIV